MYKKYFNLLLLPVIIFIAGCQNKQMNKMEEQHKAAAVKLMEIFDNGNVDDLDAIVAGNIDEHQSDTSMTKKTGLAGVKEIFSYYHKIFPDMKTTIHAIGVANDTLFIYSTSTGTAAEKFMNLMPNQKSTFTSIDVIRFDRNKVAEHWGFIDAADMMSMMQQSMMQGNSMMKDKEMK